MHMCIIESCCVQLNDTTTVYVWPKSRKGSTSGLHKTLSRQICIRGSWTRYKIAQCGSDVTIHGNDGSRSSAEECWLFDLGACSVLERESTTTVTSFPRVYGYVVASDARPMNFAQKECSNFSYFLYIELCTCMHIANQCMDMFNARFLWICLLQCTVFSNTIMEHTDERHCRYVLPVALARGPLFLPLCAIMQWFRNLHYTSCAHDSSICSSPSWEQNKKYGALLHWAQTIL